MALSLHPEHLKRYKDIARLLLKYGRSDVVREAAFAEAMTAALPEEEVPGEESQFSDAEELTDDLEALGPTFIKLGQLLSTRADLLPLPYLKALARLQDRIEPFPYQDVERIVQEELGARISKAFARFEPEPIAAASLGQVHEAELRDGRAVAVKVQRPDIRNRIIEDLAAIEEVAETLSRRTSWGRRYGVEAMVQEFRRSLLHELDYRREADNLVKIGNNLSDIDLIVVPQPIEDYTTDRVLTMDYIRGRKVTAIGPLGRLEMDGGPLADALFDAYLKQILIDGLFHADPHPGNVFVTDDRRIALLDLGMVGRMPPGLREQLLRLLLAVSEGKGEEAAEIALKIAEPDGKDFHREGFQREVVALVGEHEDSQVGELEMGTLMMRISRTAADNGVRVPRELTMLGKALLNLDAVSQVLSPDYEPNAAIRRKAARIASEQMRAGISPGNVLSSVLETAEFAQKLPGRVNRILDMLASNELRLNVEAIDEKTLIDGFQKVANRIAAGLVVAALIIGAAMLMEVETAFQILGYPGLAILCFAGAAVAGILLIYDVIAHDRPTHGGEE